MRRARTARNPLSHLWRGRATGAGAWPWQAAALFAPILAALAAGRRVIALDLPGWGLSEKPPFTGNTAADAVGVWRAALLGFLDDQGLTQTDLAGHSMGGLAALAVALDAPERVRRLALIDLAGWASRCHSMCGCIFASNRSG